MSRSLLIVPIPPLLLALTLGGCSTATDFPSLAPRPIEKAVREDADAPAAAPPVIAADPVLQQRLDAIVGSAETAHRAFLAELDNGRSAVERAAGAAPGSEAWVAGQQAYSAIDAARGGTIAALSELDDVRRERSGSLDQAALDAAAQRLSQIEADENRAVAELSEKLS